MADQLCPAARILFGAGCPYRFGFVVGFVVVVEVAFGEQAVFVVIEETGQGLPLERLVAQLRLGLLQVLARLRFCLVVVLGLGAELAGVSFVAVGERLRDLDGVLLGPGELLGFGFGGRCRKQRLLLEVTE
jgi:hypothetical protein